jgi:tetratricopeptide (TPR) repeat protein
MSTTIKFQFNDDIRRVPIDKSKLSYQDLLIKITSIYKNIPQGDVSRITVRYLDNESDMCTVTSDEELQEAFCSYSKSSNVLKLVISLSESKADTPNCNQPCFVFREFGGKWCQFKKLHRDGIALMEEKKYQAARDVFLEQVKEAKNEWQQRVPYYNIACCEALLGNSSVALEYLEKAVNCGFRNLGKIKEDPDLHSLRNLEKFQQLLNSVAQRKECKGEKDEFRAELRKKICQEWKNRCESETGEGHQLPFSVRKCHWKNRCETETGEGQQLPFSGRKCWRKFVKNNCPFEEKSEPKETAPLIEKPVVIEAKVQPAEIKPAVVVSQPSEIVIEKPVSHQYEKTLATLEEMGFLNRDLNIQALEKVNGDAKLAISVILGL